MSQHPSRPRDTAPESWEILIEVYRSMSPQRKLELVQDADRSARQLAWAGIQQRYPEDPLERRRRRLLGLVLGDDLATEVYGPLEDHP